MQAAGPSCEGSSLPDRTAPGVTTMNPLPPVAPGTAPAALRRYRQKYFEGNHVTDARRCVGQPVRERLCACLALFRSAKCVTQEITNMPAGAYTACAVIPAKLRRHQANTRIMAGAKLRLRQTVIATMAGNFSTAANQEKYRKTLHISEFQQRQWIHHVRGAMNHCVGAIFA